MCGRARCSLDPATISHVAQVPVTRWRDAERFYPSYNVAPGAWTPIARLARDDQRPTGTARPAQATDHSGEGEAAGENGAESADTRAAGGDDVARVLQSMKWGLVPSFTKKGEKPDHFRMFNARSESVHETASFRRLLPKNRCLAFFDGFYEWKKEGSKKQPYHLHLASGEPLVFAALFDTWRNEEDSLLYTYTILTTRVSPKLAWLHDRMPVILRTESDQHAWLEGEGMESRQVAALTQPYEGEDLVWYPVTPEMGKRSVGGPECVKEFKPPSLLPVKSSAIAQLFQKRKKGEEKEEVEKVKEEEEEKKGKEEEEEERKAFEAAVMPDREEGVGEEGEERRGVQKEVNVEKRKEEEEKEVDVSKTMDAKRPKLEQDNHHVNYHHDHYDDDVKKEDVKILSPSRKVGVGGGGIEKKVKEKDGGKQKSMLAFFGREK